MALAQGIHAIQTGAVQPNGRSRRNAALDEGEVYTGIGDGTGLQPTRDDGDSSLPGKTCVGKKVGDTTVLQGSGDNQASFAAEIYEQIVVLDPQSSPRIIDVFIDDKLYRRVRW